MPHRRRAHDDRHSYAAVSRFIDDDVMAVVQVVEEVPGRPAVPAGALVDVLVDIDGLWD
jgi:hypothetical protein